MIKKELFVFTLVGFTTVFVDYLSYSLLLNVLDISLAKAISFILGSIFSFLGNRRWTFLYTERIRSNLLKFIMLYSTTLLINNILNSYIVFTLVEYWFNIQLAFLIATGVSASLNFLGMKFFVFKSRA